MVPFAWLFLFQKQPSPKATVTAPYSIRAILSYTAPGDTIFNCGRDGNLLIPPNSAFMLACTNSDPSDPIVQIVREALESRNTEFKESAPFDELKWKIAKTSMAMANQRDGGRIVIGISQRKNIAEPRLGVSHEDLATYDADDIFEHVNKYAKPSVTLRVRAVEVDERVYVVIESRPFEYRPIICCRDTPPTIHSKDALRQAEVYVRFTDRIGTTRIMESSMMDELIDIAVERRARDFMFRAQRFGFHLPPTSADEFRLEAEAFGL